MPTALWRWIKETYAAVDTRSLGAFRIYLGLVLLYDLVRRVPYLGVLYSNEGVLSNHFLLFRPQATPQFSLLLACSTVNEVRVAFLAIGLVYLSYLAGLWTRASQFLALLCLISLDQRNLFLEDGGVVSTLLLLSFTLFLPLGERYSVDALVRRWRRLRHPAAAPAQVEGGPRTLHSLLVLGVLLQLVAIYVFNVLHKSGETWSKGEAIHWVLWQNRVVTPVAVFLRLHEPSWFSAVGTYATLLVEGLMPLLLLSPWHPALTRRTGFLLGLGLHLGIALLMILGPFSFAMIGFWFFLLPVDDLLGAWRWLLPGELPRVELCYDPAQPGARWVARLVATLAGRERVGFTCNIPSPSISSPDQCFTCNIDSGSTDDLATGDALSSDPSSAPAAPPHPVAAPENSAGGSKGFTCNTPSVPLLVRTGDGPWTDGVEGLSLALLGVPVAGVLLAWLARGRVGGALWRWVLDQPRDREPFLPRRWPETESRWLWAREAFGAVLILTILLQLSVDNGAVPESLRFPPPRPLASLIAYPRLLQGWRMFAPEAPKDDGILVVDAVTADGRHLDPFTNEAPEFAGASRGAVVQGAPLCDYLFAIQFGGNEPYRQELERFLNEWHTHEGHHENDRLVSYEVWWVGHQSPPLGSLETSDVARSLVLKKER
jgi:hypothetical protein